MSDDPAQCAVSDALSHRGTRPRTGGDSEISISKQRRLDKTAKLLEKNPAVNFVLQCNQLYAKLISRATGENREECVQDCLDYIDGFDVQNEDAFVGKARLKAVGRCLQMCLKYGNKNQRSFIISRLLNRFPEFCMNDTGSHLARKIVSYASPVEKQQLASRILEGKGGTLYFSRFASVIVDLLCESDDAFDGNAFRASVLRRLCVPNTLRLQLGEQVDTLEAMAAYNRVDDRGRKQMHDKMASVLTRLADKNLTSKGYVHCVVDLATATADEAQLQNYLSTLDGKLMPLLQTLIGSVALTRLIHVMDAKGRRSFVAELKSGGVDMRDFLTNNASYPAFLKLVLVTDDTQLLKKQLLAPALSLDAKKNTVTEIDKFRETCFQAAALKVLLTLLAGLNPRWLPAHHLGLYDKPSPTSKKDSRVRQMECLELVWPALCELLASDLANADTMLRWLCDRHARELPWGVLAMANSAVLPDSYTHAAGEVAGALAKGMRALAAEGRLNELLDRPVGNASVSQMLRIGAAKPQDAKAQSAKKTVLATGVNTLKLPEGQTFIEFLHDLLAKRLEYTLNSRATFLLVDALQLGQQTGHLSNDTIKETVDACKKALPPASDTPGLRLFRAKFMS